MYQSQPRQKESEFFYTKSGTQLMHGVAIRFSMMEFILAACCFVFPVWALSLQSYEGEREDDLDFL